MRLRGRWRRTFVTATASLAAILLVPSAWAAPAPGQLDPTFSEDGVVLLPDQQVAVQALRSGKALSVGSSWIVRRYTVDGPRDLAYGDGDGIAMPDFGAEAQRATDAALQPDGKLVIVGTVIEGLNERTAVARLTRRGSLDATFSGDGMRLISPGDEGFIGSSVAVSPSGRIVIAGSTWTGTADAAAVVLTSSGDRALGFGGGDGVATVDIAGDLDHGEGVDVQPDGRIVLVTVTVRPTDSMSRLGVVRLTERGELDPTFSDDGWILVAFRRDVEDWGGSAGSDVVVNPSTGEISVGGVVTYGSNDDFGYSFAVARLSGSGVVLRRWVTLPGGHFGVVRAIDLVGRDVIAVGEVQDSVADCCGWAIARFGSIEYDNRVFLPGDYNSGAFDVSVTGGKTYVVGSAEATVNGQSRRGAIARFIA